MKTRSFSSRKSDRWGGRTPYCLAALLFASPGCGGTDGPPGAVPDFPSPIGEDPGSAAADCSAAEPYEFSTIDDLRNGALTGWYTNNEVCDVCALLKADLCEICLDATNAADLGVCSQYTLRNATRLMGAPPLPSAFGGPFSGTCSMRVPAEIMAHAACAAACTTAQRPLPSADPVPGTLVPSGGVCGNAFAARIVGGPFATWGGTLGRSFGQKPWDASSWSGVSFWARFAPGSNRTVRVSISDRFTDSSYNQLLPSDERTCNPFSGTLDAKTGCDKFGSYFTGGPNWQLFFLPFTEMRQGGWGRIQPGLDSQGVRSIEFAYRGAHWDMWIADISFYRRRWR